MADVLRGRRLPSGETRCQMPPCSPPDIVWNGFQADGYVLQPGRDAEHVLAAAHDQVFGTSMEERRTTGVNDTRFYGRYYRMPSLCYGPRGESHHGFDERAHLPTLRQVTLSMACFIADWCGVREAADSSTSRS